jgi:Flp pilus assembly protein TadG
MFALLLPPLLGMAGLLLDGGRLLVNYRQAQNAADAAALAYAVDVVHNNQSDDPTKYVTTYNGLVAGNISNLNIGTPTSGPYAGNANYVEVSFDYAVGTYFIQVLGINTTQSIHLRAVAGAPPPVSGPLLVALTETAATDTVGGIKMVSVNGIIELVNGSAYSNSEGTGIDQNGNPVDWGLGHRYAMQSNGTVLQSASITTVGGVDNLNYYQNVPNGIGNPLQAGQAPLPDPLAAVGKPTWTPPQQNPSFYKYDPTQGLFVPNPTRWGGTVTLTGNQGVTVPSGTYSNLSFVLSGNSSVTFSQGVYPDVTVSAGGSSAVTLSPGVYGTVGVFLSGNAAATFHQAVFTSLGVLGTDTSPTAYFHAGTYFLKGGTSGGVALNLTTNGQVTLQQVLFYSTGSNYDVSTGNNETGNFGSANISVGQLTAAGVNGGPFNGLLLYQARVSTQNVAIHLGNNDSFSGTVYAKVGTIALTGTGGPFLGQFVGGGITVNVTGSQLTLQYSNGNVYSSAMVVLVE